MTYIDQLERIVDIVSDWAVQTVIDVTQSISPDGRGLFMVPQSDEEMLQDYLVLRGQPMAWGTYIMDAAQSIEQKLLDSGLPQDEIANVHPFDIAQKYAIMYSAEMEEKLSNLKSKEPTYAD